MDPMSTPEMPESAAPSTPPVEPEAPGALGTTAPPPHPYATPQPAPGGSTGRGGRAFTIAAMAVGLAALLTTVVAAFYSGVFVIVGVVLGIAAIALGIIALVLRQRPLAPGIVGLASGALTLVVALVVGAFALGSAFMPAAQMAADGGAGQHGGDGSGGSEVAPVDPMAPVQWPANFATGGIAFIGSGDDITTIRSDAPADSALPEPTELAGLGDGTATNRIQVYVDYRCPYCALFEEANIDTLEEVVESGSTVLELHPLTFLDRVSEGSYYSSRISGAMSCVADAQPDAAWDAHTALMDTDFQPAEGIPGHDNAAIIAELNDAVDGLNDEVRSCIETERFVPFAQALNDWVFANPVPHAADGELMVSGTPLAVVNGVPYTGDPANGPAFRAFLEEQGVALR